MLFAWRMSSPFLYANRFEPDMLAFSGCYYGGGEKERSELGAIRKRWETLPVRYHSHSSVWLFIIFSKLMLHHPTEIILTSNISFWLMSQHFELS